MRLAKLIGALPSSLQLGGGEAFDMQRKGSDLVATRLRCAAAGVLAMALTACAGAEPMSEPLRVYGNTSTIELAPVLLAIDGGLYEGPVILTNGGVPNLFNAQAVAGISEAGLADVATNADTQALRVSVQNPDLRIIMTVSEGLYRIVARRSAGIEEIADLRGKRIGAIPNTSSNYFLHKMLQTAGLTIDDVEVVRLFPMDLYKTSLADGTVDAVTVWEPGAGWAAESIPADDLVEFSGEGVYRELFNLNTTAGALADPERRGKIVAFVAALIAASDEIATNPARAQALVAESSGYDLHDVEQTWRHHAYPAALAPDLLDVLVEEDVWVARETGRAPRTREELASLVDPSVLEEAIALRGERGGR
jgi:NitT/TauT family transport system substrate-binding protein